MDFLGLFLFPHESFRLLPLCLFFFSGFLNFLPDSFDILLFLCHVLSVFPKMLFHHKQLLFQSLGFSFHPGYIAAGKFCLLRHG